MKEEKKYCLWPQYCGEKNTLSDYVCCKFCKSNHKCEKPGYKSNNGYTTCRCYDDPSKCTYSCTESDVVQYRLSLFEDKLSRVVPKPTSKPKKTEETYEEILAKRNAAVSVTKEQPVEAEDKQVLETVPSTAKEMAKMFNVTYDKVNYMLKCKHMSLSQIYAVLTSKRK